MEKENQFLLWFEQLEREDVAIVGGKSSSLGEMTAKVDVPVPYGFATTAYAYRYFFKESGLEEEVRALVAELTDVENSALLRDVCARIRKAIMDKEMPADLQEAIAAAYEELGEKMGIDQPYVAVRSSATAEDLPDASFAGQQDTYLNVQGAQTIIAKVKECYASCFTDRAVYYREKQGFDHLDVALSAAVQMMVFSKAAGVMFTVNVATGDDKNILIEGAWGLGEYVVQGTVTPDNYTVSKAEHKILEKNVNVQDVKLVRKAGGDCEEQMVPLDEQNQQKLTDEQILELAGYAKKIEEHYGCYMDMEWGVDERDNKIWILQARPETVWSRRNKENGGAPKQEAPKAAAADRKVIVKGLPASPGNVSGRVHVILDPSRIDEFKEGEILVTEMTAPDWVPAMKKAKAIVTDSYTGRTARYVAAFRGRYPVLAICYYERTIRLLALSYGVFPLYQERTRTSREYLFNGLNHLMEQHLINRDDLIAYLGGGFGEGKGTTFLEINRVGEVLDNFDHYTLPNMEDTEA